MGARYQKADVKRTCCRVKPEIRFVEMPPMVYGPRKGWARGYIIICPRCGAKTERSYSLQMAQRAWDEQDLHKEKPDGQISMFG